MNAVPPSEPGVAAVSTCDIVLAGFGGQGILLAGRLLAHAAMRDGLNVLVHNYYEGFVRGGVSECTVVLSRDEIDSPVRDRPVVVAALDGRAQEAWPEKVRAGGLLLRNVSLSSGAVHREDIRVVDLPASELASEAGSAMAVSMVVVGALARITRAYDLEGCVAALGDVVPAHRSALIDINAGALRRGAAYADEHELAERPRTAAVLRPGA